MTPLKEIKDKSLVLYKRQLGTNTVVSVCQGHRGGGMRTPFMYLLIEDMLNGTYATMRLSIMRKMFKFLESKDLVVKARRTTFIERMLLDRQVEPRVSKEKEKALEATISDMQGEINALKAEKRALSATVNSCMKAVADEREARLMVIRKYTEGSNGERQQAN